MKKTAQQELLPMTKEERHREKIEHIKKMYSKHMHKFNHGHEILAATSVMMEREDESDDK